MFKILSLKLIHRYQAYGGSKQLLNIECNFEPSCSEYTKQCIQKYGAIKGWKVEKNEEKKEEEGFDKPGNNYTLGREARKRRKIRRRERVRKRRREEITTRGGGGGGGCVLIFSYLCASVCMQISRHI